MKKIYESPVAELIDLAALERIALLPGDPENSRSDSGGNSDTPTFSSTVETDPPSEDWWN